jgi:hypothetical protein
LGAIFYIFPAVFIRVKKGYAAIKFEKLEQAERLPLPSSHQPRCLQAFPVGSKGLYWGFVVDSVVEGGAEARDGWIGLVEDFGVILRGCKSIGNWGVDAS